MRRVSWSETRAPGRAQVLCTGGSILALLQTVGPRPLRQGLLGVAMSAAAELSLAGSMAFC